MAPEPAPHLLYVNSRPTLVSPETWTKYYTEEHLADLIKTGTSKTAALYEEAEIPGSESPRKFLALYQTDFAEPLNTPNAKTLMWTSEILREGGKHTDVGLEHIDPDTRNYELIQMYDPNSTGDAPAPAIITAEMHPKNVADFDKWYREEHLQMLSELPGYRRTLRYKLGPKIGFSKGVDEPAFIALHEVEDVEKALKSEESKKATETEWTKKVIGDCDKFVARGWRLVKAEGQ